MTYNLCTYFDSVYLAKGLALHESLERHCPNRYHLWVLALDERVQIVMAKQPNVSVVPLKNFETQGLRAACADRTNQERCWTYTPWWMKFVLNSASIDDISCVDADICFFDDPAPVFEELAGKGVAITPHRFPPKYKAFEKNGLYNVGLVYLERDSQKGKQCIDEWAELCLEWCYYRHDPNDPLRFCDQKYWDMLVPKYDAHVIQHLGANLAPWNAEGFQHRIYNDRFYVGGYPLIWYHFHGLSMSSSGQISLLYPPTYTLPAIVHEHIYGPYQAALGRAQERMKK